MQTKKQQASEVIAREGYSSWSKVIGIVSMIILGAGLWFAWDYEAFLAWKRDAGALPFFTALAIMPAFGIPITPFYLLVGATFGMTLGLIGSALSLAVNLVLCYWIARSGLRRILERLLAHTRYTLPTVWPGHEFRFTLIVRLVPGLPIFIKNYLLSIGGVPFLTYFLVSFTVTLVYAVVFIMLGESLYKHDLNEATGALIILVLFGLITEFSRRHSKLTSNSGEVRQDSD
ncbi:TVP38/TMEM64 family protein [Nitrosococcus wardiae]|uniref:TVP38/TMEM64 family membrane protein n=1 Tax=Nitrosococcus wardiae TaxID=1814290 RepID=A0A4P7BV98_9GAMM|nr:VTT domain-containing protein [Nitrosococcus wardiae]QBQ53928.1 TVP38/TMEM64 family protein [Nitrosococcus wardiae]